MLVSVSCLNRRIIQRFIFPSCRRGFECRHLRFPSQTLPIQGLKPAAPLPVDKSRFRFQKLLQPFAVEAAASPRRSFGSCSTGWCWASPIASLLVVESWWVKVFASLVAALWIARLFVIGHDACHGSYTPNKTLNKWIGRIAFLPSLTPYSLWEIGHNLAHHGFTNLKGPRLRLDALLARRIRKSAVDPAAAGAHLSQRRRSGRLLHDRDVVEEVVLPGPQARCHAAHQLHLGQPAGGGLRRSVGRRLGRCGASTAAGRSGRC